MNKPKKVLYIHHGKGLGGAPLSLLYMIQSLDRTKFEPVVLFLHNSDVIELYKKQNIQIIGPAKVYDFAHTKIWWFKWYHSLFLFRAIKDTLKTIFFTAPKYLKQIKPDLVHLNTSSLIGWAIAARRKKIPVVWHIRETLAPGYFGIRRWLVKAMIKKYATNILPICKNDSLPWAQLEKTHVVYNAVDTNQFCPARVTQKIPQKFHPTILFVGGLSQEKGTLDILEIFKLVLKQVPQAKLHIAGYCDLSLSSIFFTCRLPGTIYKQEVKQLVARMAHAVKFLGPITTMPEAMAASDVVVFPSTQGHFARPIIEAGFMKKPVVASAMKPLDELVIHEKTGYLIDINDHQAWAEHLVKLLIFQGLNKSMGEQAYEFCRQNFSLENQAKKIDKIYTALFEKPNRDSSEIF